MEIKIYSAEELISSLKKGIDRNTLVIPLVKEPGELIVWEDVETTCFESWHVNLNAPFDSKYKIRSIEDENLYEKIIDNYNNANPIIIESSQKEKIASSFAGAILEFFYEDGMKIFDNEEYNPDISVYNTAYGMLKKKYDTLYLTNGGEYRTPLKTKLYEKALSMYDSISYGEMFMEEEMKTKKRKRMMDFLEYAYKMDGDEDLDAEIEDIMKEIQDDEAFGCC